MGSIVNLDKHQHLFVTAVPSFIQSDGKTDMLVCTQLHEPMIGQAICPSYAHMLILSSIKNTDKNLPVTFF